MSYELSPEERDRVLEAEDVRAYGYFVDKAAEHGEIWSVWSDDAWGAVSDEDDVELFPAWPHSGFVQAALTDDWEESVPKAMELQVFLERLEELGGDIAVLLREDGSFLRIAAEDVAADLRDALRRIEWETSVTYDLRDAEREKVLGSADEDKYTYLVRKAASSGAVWSVSHVEGFGSLTSADKRYFPIWPHPAFIDGPRGGGAWQGATPEAIETHDFLELCDELAERGDEVAMFHGPTGDFITIGPKILADDIRTALDTEV